MVYVVLLRGINVGGKNAVNMPKLRAMLEGLGYDNVSTYINSGNAFFTAKKVNPRGLEDAIENALLNEFKLGLKVVVRSLPEIKALMNTIPKNWYTDPSRKYNVIFLRHEIDSLDIIKQFEPKPNIETATYYPGTLLWSASTSDLTKTTMVKLAKYKSYKHMTIRNLNTAVKIHQIMTDLSS